MKAAEEWRVLLDRILKAENEDAKQQAEYEMAQFIRRYCNEPRDYKLAQAGDEQ